MYATSFFSPFPVRQDANGALCFTEIRQLADRTGEVVSNETLRRAMNLADHNDKGITRKGLEDPGADGNIRDIVFICVYMVCK